jgi:ribonuclease P protein component
LGLTVPRAVGGAVERNRIKRRLREAFRLARPSLGDVDIVLNPRRAVLAASFEDLQKALAEVMERAR